MYVSITGAGKARVIQFVEQKRIPKTNKKQTIVIKTLGNYEEMIAKDPYIIEKLKAEAKRLTAEKKAGKKPIMIDMDTHPINSSEDTYPSYFIGHQVIKQLWQDLKLDDFFEQHLPTENQAAVHDTIFQLVGYRIMHPQSVFTTGENLLRYAGVRQYHLKANYNVLDHLHPLSDSLIDHLYQQLNAKTTRTEPVAYYIVTPFSFENVNTGEFKLFKNFKEDESNEAQGTMGLLIDNQGLPISYQLFPRGTMGQNTLKDAVGELKKRYKLDKVVVVTDHKLHQELNFSSLTQQSHDFMIGYTLKQAPVQQQGLVLNAENWEVIETDTQGKTIYKSKVLPYTFSEEVSPTEKNATNLASKRDQAQEYKNRDISTHVHVTWSKKRAEKDRKDRERTLANVICELVDTTPIQSVLNDQSQFDGYYVVMTNQMNASTDETGALFKSLWQTENIFRPFTNDLQTQSIFIRADHHIRGHFTMCFLAFTLLRYLQHTLSKFDHPLTEQQIAHALGSAQVTAIGKYPLLTLIPTHITDDYITILNDLGFPPLMSQMDLNEFKKATNLDLTVNEIN